MDSQSWNGDANPTVCHGWGAYERDSMTVEIAQALARLSRLTEPLEGEGYHDMTVANRLG